MTVKPIGKTGALRNDSIDLIRGLSIFLVIIFHLYIHFPIIKESLSDKLPKLLNNIFFQSGYYAVIVFFVVSGFLITKTSLRRWENLKNLKCTEFYYIRFARIGPCLIGLLLILSVLDLFAVNGFTIHTTSLTHAIFAALTFHINWLEANTGYLPGTWDILWSLSIEETFYIFFPLLCRFVRNELRFILVMLIFIILGPFARSIFSHNEIWLDHSYLSCMDGIALGCLAALLSNKKKLNHSLVMLFFFIGLSIFSLIFFFRKVVYSIGLTNMGLNVTILELSIFFILIAVDNIFNEYNNRRKSITAIFRWFGKNSYEIYLTHVIIITFGVKILNYHYQIIENIFLIYFIFLIALSGLVGHIIAKYYSEPFNKFLRAKYYKSF